LAGFERKYKRKVISHSKLELFYKPVVKTIENEMVKQNLKGGLPCPEKA
jgi:hypothetical protein